MVHHLRHVAGTVAVRVAGADRAKLLTGHASRRALEIYTHLAVEDVLPAAAAVEQAWAAARLTAKPARPRVKIGKPKARSGGSRGEKS